MFSGIYSKLYKMDVLKIDKLWQELLELRKSDCNEHLVIGWTYGKDGFHSHVSKHSIVPSDSKAILLKSRDNFKVQSANWSSIKLPFEDMNLFFDESISVEVLNMLKLYWPLSIMHLTKRDKPFIIVHIASTLDGKIATHNGDSKWIGNEENLIHSHRVRALIDAVLIGAGTVKSDQPSLNVRHVAGENPIRLILSNKTNDFSALQAIENSKTLLLRESGYACSACNSIDEVVFYSGENSEHQTNDLLQKLYKKGVKSILIEGGSRTISNIFSSKSFDVFQIHYEPIMIGSGKGIIDLPEIDKLSEATEFRNSIWTRVGDSFMITAQL